MRVYLVGIGMGNPGTLTLAARDAVRRSQLLVGARRMLDAVRPVLEDAAAPRMVEAVRADDILEALRGSDAACACVLFSGDVGFYSGANLLYQRLGEVRGLEVEAMPGVSSLSYLCARLQVPWQDAHVVSVHGRTDNVAGAVQAHRKTFVLTGGQTKAQDVCADLVAHGLGDVRASAGERLSYPEERVVSGSARELACMAFADLTVLLVQNDAPVGRLESAPCLADDAFLRGKTPMTKEEVRELAICKLRLRPGHVLWDVGAGTGSVSVEGALAVPEGQVFAIEKDEDALALLRANRARFGLCNLQVVAGRAPQALAGLPAPDRVFIGGSSGDFEGILRVAVAANPNVRVVASCITLETVSAALAAFSDCGLADVDVVQVGVARGRKAGPYHLMMAQNPVYLFCAGGNVDGGAQ
jgi:precorrin-6Y C5,15-methyltransferase (decarboxylating)